MRVAMRIGAALAALGLLGAAPAPERRYVAFVTCPVLRDTPELPCWMARNKGQLYYLGIQSGRSFGTKFFPPQMKHKVLVEGFVSAAAPICGGVPTDALQVSTLPEISPECNEMLPTDGHVSPKGRPAGADAALPPGAQTALRGPQDAAPVLYKDADVAARAPKSFDVLYTFDSDFAQYPLQQNRIVQAQRYVKAIGASAIRVTAYRGASRLNNGRKLVENPRIPVKRAGNVHASLLAFYIDAKLVRVEVRKKPEPVRGAGDYRGRRVQIDVLP